MVCLIALPVTAFSASENENAPVLSTPADDRALLSKLNGQQVEYFQNLKVFNPSSEDEAEYLYWGILVYRKSPVEQVLSVFKQGKQIYRYSRVEFLDHFVHLQVVEMDGYAQPLIASVWTRGVHGEQFILVDPIEKKIVYEQSSSWPISFEVNHQEMIIHFTTDDNDSEGAPIEKTDHWSRTGVVHTHIEKLNR